MIAEQGLVGLGSVLRAPDASVWRVAALDRRREGRNGVLGIGLSAEVESLERVPAAGRVIPTLAIGLHT